MACKDGSRKELCLRSKDLDGDILGPAKEALRDEILQMLSGTKDEGVLQVLSVMRTCLDKK